jgi:hypothetical protein
MKLSLRLYKASRGSQPLLSEEAIKRLFTARVKGQERAFPKVLCPTLDVGTHLSADCPRLDATGPFAAIERSDVSDLGETLSFFDPQMPN